MTYEASLKKAEYKRNWRRNNGEEARKRGVEYSRRYWELNKLKCRARYLVRKALRNRVLRKEPCRVCGESEAEAHHEDYDKPLDVVWLCKEHHKDLHAGRISILFV